MNMVRRDGACSIAIGAGVRFLPKRADVTNRDGRFTAAEARGSLLPRSRRAERLSIARPSIWWIRSCHVSSSTLKLPLPTPDRLLSQANHDGFFPANHDLRGFTPIHSA